MSNLLFDKIDDAALMVSHFYDSVRMDALFGDRAGSDNPETDRTRKLPLGEGTPSFQDIDFSELTVGGSPKLALAVIEGLPERYIRGLSIRDLVAPQARAGVLLTRASQTRIAGLRMNPTDGPAIAARDVERLQVEGLVCPKPDPKVPVIRLESTAGVFVHGCDIGPGAKEFVRAEGKANRDLTSSATTTCRPSSSAEAAGGELPQPGQLGQLLPEPGAGQRLGRARARPGGCGPAGAAAGGRRPPCDPASPRRSRPPASQLPRPAASPRARRPAPCPRCAPGRTALRQRQQAIVGGGRRSGGGAGPAPERRAR